MIPDDARAPAAPHSPAHVADPLDPEIAGALAARSITRALAILAGVAFGVGVVGACAASLAQVDAGGEGTALVTPGLLVLMVGQAAALVATGLAAWTLLLVLRERVPTPQGAVAGLSRGLGLCSRGLLAGIVLSVGLTVAIWPETWMSSLLGGAVAVQVATAFGMVRRSVLRPRG